MIRFETISLFGSGFTKYELPIYDKGKRIVDDSNFIPMSETVKQLSKTLPLAKGVIDTSYDFPDGQDDGRKVDIARMRPEIVELSEEVRKNNTNLRKALNEVKQIADDNVKLQSLTKKE